MEKAVTIYSTPTCPFCSLAKEYLQENNIEFKEIDVAADQEAAAEMVQKSGQMGVPVIEVGERVIVGFDKDELKDALEL